MQRALSALAIGLFLLFSTPLPSLAAGVRVTVNETPITDVQIQQRAKLLRLQQVKGNLTKTATDQLINEALELQDAKRYGITVTDADVDQSFNQMAQGLRISQDKLRQILIANGVGIDTLKAQIRASLAFNQIQQNVITPRVQISEAQLAKQAEGKVTQANSWDYILKQIQFLPSQGRSAASRMGDAQRYRAKFHGCDSAVPLSESFVDAAVTDIGRRHATQLDPKIAAELGKLPVGGITRPAVEQNAVSMLAICSKEQARDLTFITNQLRASEGNDKLQQQTDQYLAGLKAQAKIVYSH